MLTTDVFGTALKDYLIGNEKANLILRNSYGNPEKMPVSVFFREECDLTPLERLAVESCHGRVLDIGAGVGAISRIAQTKYDLVALERSSDACEVGKLLGVKQVVQGDIWEYGSTTFDTLLLLMNGIGIVEKLNKLTLFLLHLKKLLNTEGQILLDSSDLTYLYPKIKSFPRLGEISYQYEYKGQLGPWFNWLYIDKENLRKHALEAGFNTRILLDTEEDQYLAQLTLSN